MIDFIDLIRESCMPVIWALRYEDYWNQHMTVIDIIRMLVLQTIQVGAGQFLDNIFPVTVEHLREAASLHDWVAILSHLLSTISQAYIVLDADLLAHVTAHDRSEALEIMDALRLKVYGNVKIVTAMLSVSRAYAEDLEHSGMCVRIQAGKPRDWRNVRRKRRPLLRGRNNRL
jgi:hypothetical protein